MSIYQGYIALHDLSQEVPSFETDINRNNYYSNLVLSIREPIDKALHSSSLNYFVGTESEIDNDYKSLLEETVPLIEELKQNGSLRKVYFSNS